MLLSWFEMYGTKATIKSKFQNEILYFSIHAGKHTIFINYFDGLIWIWHGKDDLIDFGRLRAGVHILENYCIPKEI